MKKGKHKKHKIVLAIIAAAAAVMGLTFWRDVPPGSLLDRWLRPVQEVAVGPVTAMVVRQDIEEIYQTNGSIISNESLVVNAESSEGGSTSGYVVDKVNVAVGDTVQAGDVLFTLDMTATENELELKRKQLAIQQSSNAIDANAQQRLLASEQRQLDNQNAANAAQAESDTRKLQQSADDVNFAIADNVEAAARVRTLIQQENNAKAVYQAAQETYDSLQSDYEDRQDKANDIAVEMAGKSTGDEGYQDLVERQARAQADLSTAQTDLSRAETDLSEARSAYSEATSAREAAESALSEKDQQILSNYRALLDQGDSVESNVRQQQEDLAAKQDAVAAQQDAVAKQNLSNQSSTIEQEEAIRTATQKLSMNTVTAPISGTVTTVNVLDGQIYNGTRAVVIQNLDSMKATADIPEAEIADLPEGTAVRITTDATGDETLEGTISFVSPVPTSQQGETSSDSMTTSSGSSGAKPKYQVNVAISSDTSRLFIGMTARLQFILKSNKDTLAVPTSCIQDDGMGGQFVTVVQGDGSDLTNTLDVMVETGAADDSMTAITSGNLNEGDLIIDYGASMDDGSGDLSMDGIY